FFARREAENRRALAVRKVFSDEGLREIYKFYANVFRWSGYNSKTVSPGNYSTISTIKKGCGNATNPVTFPQPSSLHNKITYITLYSSVNIGYRNAYAPRYTYTA
ncbi:MAG: hypothetical protein FWC78_08765, partial [Defluviitaleaceae bacterium]|nr:hypothetical protein [Defluviitaleaceae bacterium]